MRRLTCLLGFVLMASGVYRADQLAERGFSGSIEHPAINYAGRPSHDAVATLARAIEAERVHLAFDARSGYLRSMLDALHVPVESQMLVFSKTGVQRDLTNLENPRALFFNDSVAVGYVRGAPVLELASHDPEQGVVFYTMVQTPNDPPRIVRRDGCLACHESFNSLDVPGMLVRSNFTAPDGNILRQLGGSRVIDHRSPFEQRWGGWYVTGASGAMRHMGNAIVTDPARPETMISAGTLNLTSVESRFDTQGYPSAYSDIVALMVFEHQMHMINLLTRVGWETRLALFEHRPHVADGLLRDAINELVDYMLFVDEPPLPSKIQGSSGFAEKFAAAGPKDRAGRSLRQLDLTTRLMRYPCSYMIYAEAFDHLPVEARDAIAARLWDILSGRVEDRRYGRLTRTDRQAIIQILRETKKTLPEYWR